MSRFLLMICTVMLETGCAQLVSLNADLNQASEVYQEFTVTTPNDTIQKRYVFVQLSTFNSEGILTANVINSGTKINIPSFFNLTSYILVFEDTNIDFTYSVNKPTYLFSLSDIQSNNIIISPEARLVYGIPALNELSLYPYLEFEVKPERLGKIVDWNDPAFSAKAREMSMWQPIKFIEKGYAGIFFFEPYAPEKIPVFYIHGMGGSGQDFETMISTLDRSIYQPWIINYPSSLSLTLLSHSIAGMMRQLHNKFAYKSVHIVAHSMGGVLTQRYLNICGVANRCELVRSFTSIASPFGGVSSAESGVKYSPVVMPSWNDLAPNGSPIQGLFPKLDSNHLPPHLLIFTYDKSSSQLGESSDGTIPLSSQLRVEAQAQSRRLYGVDANHTNVLNNIAVNNEIERFWLIVEHGN